jgi:MFS family permease
MHVRRFRLRDSFTLRRFRAPVLPRWSAAEIAIAVLFATNGLLFGGWIVRIPAIISRLDVSTGTFGLILPAGAVGAILALPASGKLAGRFGSARVLTAFSLTRSIVVPLMILFPHPIWFAIGLFCYGFTNGALDVALNAQGVEVERASRRSILSTLHGCSSSGSLIGSLIGGIAAGLGIGVVPQLTATCILIAVLTLILFRNLVPDEPHAVSSTTTPRRKLFFLPPKVLLPFGAIAFCSVIGEGGIGDWGTLYLRNETGTSASLAAFGYTTFALCMLIGRFMGDRVVRRFGEERTIRGASLTAGAGLLAASGIGTLWAGYLGFGVAGLGLSLLIPITYRMAGNTPGIPRAQAVASTALIAYLGFLVGPLILGTIGDVVSIRLAIATIAVTVLCVHFFAHSLRPKPIHSPDADFRPIPGTVTVELPVS